MYSLLLSSGMLTNSFIAAMGFSVQTDKDYVNSHHDLVYVMSREAVCIFVNDCVNCRTLSSTRSKSAILMDALIPFVLMFLWQAAMYLPTSASRLIQKNKAVSTRVSNQLLQTKVEALKMGDESGKDLLSVLGMREYFLKYENF